jgi:hypothetical protein
MAIPQQYADAGPVPGTVRGFPVLLCATVSVSPRVAVLRSAQQFRRPEPGVGQQHIALWHCATAQKPQASKPAPSQIHVLVRRLPQRLYPPAQVLRYVLLTPHRFADGF